MSKQNGNQDFKRAEAIGQIKTMPTQAEPVGIAEPEAEGVVSTPHDFQAAIGRCQMEGPDYLEVSDKLFSFLVKGQKTDSLTYGKPAIRVFRAGTRDAVLKIERLNAEQYHEFAMKQANQVG